MALLVQDLYQYLIDNNVVTIDEGFFNYTPDEPNNIVVLSEYGAPGGPIGDESMSRRVQFKIRNSDSIEAAKKSWQIYNLFIQENKYIFHINENRHLIPRAVQQPAPFQVDNNERTVYVFNLSFTTNKDF